MNPVKIVVSFFFDYILLNILLTLFSWKWTFKLLSTRTVLTSQIWYIFVPALSTLSKGSTLAFRVPTIPYLSLILLMQRMEHSLYKSGNCFIGLCSVSPFNVFKQLNECGFAIHDFDYNNTLSFMTTTFMSHLISLCTSNKAFVSYMKSTHKSPGTPGLYSSPSLN